MSASILRISFSKMLVKCLWDIALKLCVPPIFKILWYHVLILGTILNHDDPNLCAGVSNYVKHCIKICPFWTEPCPFVCTTNVSWLIAVKLCALVYHHDPNVWTEVDKYVRHFIRTIPVSRLLSQMIKVYTKTRRIYLLQKFNIRKILYP